MSDENQKPAIEELYAVAISSGTGFDRLVLAAGLQREIVGTMLLRLRAEYDQVRKDLERAGQIAPRRIEEARELRQRAQRLQKNEHWADAEALIIQAEAIQARTSAEVKSARAFILLGLITLHDAKQQLGALAVRMAAKPNRALAPEAALRLADRVLDVWLDEVCHKCDGTGRLGNRFAGDRERECPACKGSGHRRDGLGETARDRAFASDLLAEVQRQVEAAAAGIRVALVREAEVKPVHPDLARRLAELRGEQAVAD